MSPEPYLMRDHARDTVRDIMGERPGERLLTRPSWVALTLLVMAFNLLAFVPAA